MAIKDILVHLSGTKYGHVVVDAAITLAERHDARLIGIFAGVPYDMPTYVVAQLPPEVIQQHQQNVEENEAAAKTAFEETCKKNGISCETRSGDWRDQVEDVICAHARYADIVVMGQPNDDVDAQRTRAIADHVILGSGTPVIVTPRTPALKGMGTKVLIGWDGSDHAARAVRNALPILKSAKSVKVLCVDPKPGVRGLGDLPGADLARYLASHGVNAEADHYKSEGKGVGVVLLNEAANIGADMIVVGGYGHSRLGELILGGATNTLLDSMTVPVLFAH